MKKSKNLRKILLIVVAAIVILVASLFSLWFHYANKYNLIKEYSYDGNKDVYILGTLGKHHFNRFNNYSFENLCDAIDNINPDLILITARQDHYDLHSIIDGDIDMCVAYAKCLQNNIPVNMVDWWMLDNIYPEEQTTNLRDDNIFIKICRIMKNIQPNTKVLIITGTKHFYELTPRFEVAGWKKLKIEDKGKIFKSNRGDGQSFEYPPLASKIWRDRAYFYAYTFPNRIKNYESLCEQKKKKYLNADHSKFYRKQIKYCRYLIENKLYK